MILVMVAVRWHLAKMLVVDLYSYIFVLRNLETTGFGAVLCVFSRKRWVTLELLQIMSLTEFLSIFKCFTSSLTSDGLSVLLWTSGNGLPAPQEHFGSGCLMHREVIRHQQQSHGISCSVIPLAVSCRHSMVCGGCCCPSSQSWYAALSALGALPSQWHAAFILQRTRTYPNPTSRGRCVDEKGLHSGAWISVSLRTRQARDTNAVSSGCHCHLPQFPREISMYFPGMKWRSKLVNEVQQSVLDDFIYLNFHMWYYPTPWNTELRFSSVDMSAAMVWFIIYK